MSQCNRNPLRIRWLFGLVLIALVVGAFGLLGPSVFVQAAPVAQPTPPPLAVAVPMTNDFPLQ